MLIGVDKMNCIFCKIINGEIPSYKIYEDEQVLIFLDINPDTNGHTLVIPKTHYQDIFDIDKNTLREKKISDIRNRVKIGNESSADIFVSIHLNKIPQSQYDGWQTFYKPNDEKSMKLAKSIQTNLNDAIQKENKRVAVKLDTVYIMKHVEIPISIVECGFLSNPDEEELLLSDEYQNKLAWGIYNGIIDYFYE